MGSKLALLERKNVELEAEKEAEKEAFKQQLEALGIEIENERKTQLELLEEERAEQQKLKEKLAFQETEYNKILAAFLQLQRHRFGNSSERFIDTDQQLPLLAGVAPEETAESTDDDVETITYNRKKNSKKKNPVCPVREEIIPVDDKTCECGAKRTVIDYETKTMLHYVPAQFELIEQKREVVACNHCDKGIETAPAPLQLLPKCKAKESLLTAIAISKVLDRQPLYHLEKKFTREYDWTLPRKTMARWMVLMGLHLTPLVNALKDVISDYDIASADATSLQVLNEPNKRAEQKSYAYCIRGGPPDKEVVIFDYVNLNHKAYLRDAFSGFKGFIHSDADPVYDELSQTEGIQFCLCHAHARRKFEQIYKASKKKGKLAKHAMWVYKKLYAIEREATEKALSDEDRLELRQKQSKPLLDEFKVWLDHHADLTFPKSPIAKAIAYTRNHWDGLQTFLTDGRLSPDNNATEREIKTFVMARKNFLFAQSQPGADSLGALFSIILTAKHHGLNPRLYFETVLKKAPRCETFSDWEALLPWNWKHDLGPA